MISQCCLCTVSVLLFTLFLTLSPSISLLITRCWEDLYWNCIEEKFCFDEEIAKYNPDDDENYIKKETANGFVNGGLTGQANIREVRDESEVGIHNNNDPICVQPKLTEAEFYREIQTTVPILAPEVLAAFANSQIFHEHASSKMTSPTSPPAGVHQSSSNSNFRSRADSNAEELLKRLEGESFDSYFLFLSVLVLLFVGSTKDLLMFVFFLSIFMSYFALDRVQVDQPKPSNIDTRRASASPAILRHQIPKIIEEKHHSDDKLSSAVDAGSTPSPAKEYLTPESFGSMKIVNKILQLEAPYFSYRTASENDIFAITQPNNATNRISQTPEVPSVSFNALPKNYLDTPSIGEYRESKSLYEIQTAGIHQQADVEKLSMPRYYSKSHLFAKNEGSSNESVSVKEGDHRTPKRTVEKSRRLKTIRMQLPPLMIGHDKSKEGKSTRG